MTLYLLKFFWCHKYWYLQIADIPPNSCLYIEGNFTQTKPLNRDTCQASFCPDFTTIINNKIPRITLILPPIVGKLRLSSVKSSTGGWMVRALVCQADGRVFESNQWLSFDFQILSYLLRFKIRVSTLCASFRTSHSWAYSPVTAVWSPSGQLAGCGLDYGCGRRRTMSIPVRLRAAILGAKRSYSCSSDCLVLRLCQLLSSIYD